MEQDHRFIKRQVVPMQCFKANEAAAAALSGIELDGKKADMRFSVVLPSDEIAHVPVEIKWAHNDEIWTSAKNQLVEKYMLDEGIRFGLYIVGWAGQS